MAYTIRTYDNKSIVVSDEAGIKTQQAKLNNDIKTVIIGANLYQTADIRSIVKGGFNPLPSSHQIFAGDTDRRQTPGLGFQKYKQMRKDVLGN